MSGHYETAPGSSTPVDPAPEGGGDDAGASVASELNRRGFVGVAGLLVGAAGASDRRQAGADVGGPAGFSAATKLDAGDFGIVGDGRADETARVQAFLDACAARGKQVANFGVRRVRISGPLHARSVGVVFDQLAYGGGGDAGFQVSGAGYTALTVTGLIADFNVTVFGDGHVDVQPNGVIARDDRPRVNGIQFGSVEEPLIGSVIRHARAFRLSGCGIRHVRCWDTSFLAESVELCGNADQFAFEVAASATENCNESVWLRVQVELAAIKAMHVHANTLSCSFSKIHSERVTGGAAEPAWQLNGACSYDSVRLHATNPIVATAKLVSGQGQYTNLRAESDRLRVLVDATGGTINLHNPAATLECSPNQNGRVNVIGGHVNALAVGANWCFVGTSISDLEIGYMPPGRSSMAIDCDVDRFRPQPGAVDGEFAFSHCSIRGGAAFTPAGRLRHLLLFSGTEFRSAGEVRFGAQSVTVDATSRIVGHVVLDGCALRLDGSINGDLTVQGPACSLAGADAYVTGAITGWTHPAPSARLAPFAQGSTCKNLAPSAADGQAALVTGWIFAAGRWRAQLVAG